jgi:DNA-binding transcriptional LysR family regulator
LHGRASRVIVAKYSRIDGLEPGLDRFSVMSSFVAVAKTGSFTGAAKTLGLSRALLSRHVADLEKRVGTRLINRTTRSVSLTEAGELHYEFCERVLKDLAAQEEIIGQMRKKPEGSLAIVAPKWIGIYELGDAITAFAEQHPLIKIRFEVGGMSNRSYDFVQKGYDIAFNTKNVKDSGVIAKRVATLRFVLCASPKYLQKRGVPRDPHELTKHDWLIHTNEPVWHLAQTNKEEHWKVHNVAFTSNTYVILRKAALEGLGVAVLPLNLVGPDIKLGHLRPLLSEHKVPDRPLYLICPPGTSTIQKVRTFIDFVGNWFRRNPALSAEAA